MDKVYCKGCKYYSPANLYIGQKSICLHPESQFYIDTPEERITIYCTCSDMNGDNKCEDFTPNPGQRENRG